MIVAWNALMISGLAKAAKVFDRADYLALAIEAAEFIQQRQQVGDAFYRLNYDGQVAVLAQSEDYALFIQALLDIQQSCLKFDDYREQEANWLASAIALQAQFDRTLGSEQGGYFNASSDLIVQERAYQDSAVPSANGIAIANLIRLFLLTENLDYLSHAEAALKSFSTMLQKAPRACPSLLNALDWFIHPTLIRTTAEQMPQLQAWPLQTAVIKLEPTLPEGTVGMVCEGLLCRKPAADIAMMKAQVEQSQR